MPVGGKSRRGDRKEARQPVSRILSTSPWGFVGRSLILAQPLSGAHAAYPRVGRNGPFRWRLYPPPRLFGLAPDGVYHAADRYRQRGGLLPHRFTLACFPLRGSSAVSSLLHFPSPRDARRLAGILPSGVRTFLPSRERKGDRPAASHFSCYAEVR